MAAHHRQTSHLPQGSVHDKTVVIGRCPQDTIVGIAHRLLWLPKTVIHTAVLLPKA